MTAPARLNLVSHGLKKPEIAYLPTACAETLPIPTHFCVERASGTPVPRPFSFCRDPGSRAARPGFRSSKLRLLELNLGASLLELSLDLLGFVLVHAFLDRLGRALDEVLGFLEAEAGDGADFLDDFDLLLAGGGEHDRELGLFFSRSRGSSGRTGNRNGGSGGHAPLFFKELCELGSLEHGEAREVVNNLL